MGNSLWLLVLLSCVLDIVLEALQVLPPQFHEVRVISTSNNLGWRRSLATRSDPSWLPLPLGGCRENPRSWKLWGVGGEGKAVGHPWYLALPPSIWPSLSLTTAWNPSSAKPTFTGETPDTCTHVSQDICSKNRARHSLPHPFPFQHPPAPRPPSHYHPPEAFLQRLYILILWFSLYISQLMSQPQYRGL